MEKGTSKISLIVVLTGLILFLTFVFIAVLTPVEVVTEDMDQKDLVVEVVEPESNDEENAPTPVPQEPIEPKKPSTFGTFTCTEKQRNLLCTDVYEPVCGLVNVQCITTPCDPVSETYSNGCHACSNSLVESYTAGECNVANEQ